MKSLGLQELGRGRSSILQEKVSWERHGVFVKESR